MIRAIAIDDEEASIKTLKTFASRIPEKLKIVDSAPDAHKGISLIENYKPDVVFLDISMPGINGFQLLEQFVHNRCFSLVFITAHEQYAIKAIKEKAFDYLLKPIDFDDFTRCVEALPNAGNAHIQTKNASAPTLVSIKSKDGVIFLKQSEIVSMKAAGSYTEFYMDNGVRHVASKRIGDFESRLQPGSFFRCHKSHIINLTKVQKVICTDGTFVLMTDGSMLNVSKPVKDELLQRLEMI